jgi:hypothetical protein
MKVLSVFILLLLSISVSLFSQNNQKKYNIQIVDSRNNEALPFATILINKNRHNGLVTNLNGRSEFYLSPTDTCIQISYVGFETKLIKRNQISSLVKLKAIEVDIAEAVIYARENPAHRIIKKAVANRKINNPDNIPEYACKIYNKSIYDYIFKEESLNDTSIDNFVKLFSENYVLLMESATERFYKAPNKTFEEIKKVRVSGFKDPSIAPLSTDLQPFHFYNPMVELLDIAFLNPISSGSHRKYIFIIEDTLYNNIDTTFIISFRPKRNTNFDGLKGFVHINTNKYAIENVVVSPAEKKLMSFHIQQKYEFINNYWFPKELKSELRWEDLYNQDLGIALESESYIDGFRINIPKDSVKYTEEVLVFDPLATKDAKIEMNKYRNSKLSLKEKSSYHMMDSIGEELKLDNKLNFLEKIVEWKVPIGKFYFPLKALYMYNDFEGSRLGFGLYTDNKLVKWMELGAWGAYGFKDKQWKYGSELSLFFDRKHENALTTSYRYDAVFPGNEDFVRKKSNIEGYFLQQADYSEQLKVSYKTRIRYLQLKFDLVNDKRSPQYNYSFLLDNNWVNKYETTEIGVQMRFAFKEKYMWQLKQKIAFETKWPVLVVGYKKGLKDFYGGELDYDKLWAQIDYTYHFARLGKTNIRLEAGKIWGDIPYSFLFSGAGGFDSSIPIFVDTRFNTMPPNEFVNDEIVNFYFSHDFGTLLFSTSKWKPKVKLTQAFGIGNLKNKHLHTGIELTDMNKGYYESGLVVNDIVRLNYLNFFYIGIGGGVFYNYGYYSSDTWENNIKFKISASFSF